jgi:hypothetical protein
VNILTSREFQLNYQRLDEPVTVMARSRTLGTWYPKGTEPDEIKDALPQSDVYLTEPTNEVARLTSELAARAMAAETAALVYGTTPDNVHAPKVAVRAGLIAKTLGALRDLPEVKSVHPAGTAR